MIVHSGGPTGSQLFWVELDTAGLENFTISLTIAADHVRRDLDHDKTVTSVFVAASDAERALALRVCVDADGAMTALHRVTAILERCAEQHRLGPIAVLRISATPADMAVNPPGAGTAMVAVEPVTAPVNPVRRRSHRDDHGHAAFEAGQALAATRHLVVELGSHGAVGLARPLERWLASGINAHEALRGLHHELGQLRAAAIQTGDPGLERRIADVIAAVDTAIAAAG